MCEFSGPNRAMTRNPVYSFVSVCVQSVPGLFLGAFPAPNVVKFSTVRSIQPHSQGKDLKRGWCSLVRSLIPYSLRAFLHSISSPSSLTCFRYRPEKGRKKRETGDEVVRLFFLLHLKSYWKNNLTSSPLKRTLSPAHKPVECSMHFCSFPDSIPGGFSCETTNQPIDHIRILDIGPQLAWKWG